MAEFKDRLEEALSMKDMKPSELSKQTGIGEGAISQYRKGKYKASQRNLEKISRALNVSISWLMGISDELTDSYPPSLHPLPDMKEWPVLGATACGKTLHRELLDETVLAPADIKADVVFRCIGDSMVNARIFDGDLVFVRLQPEVETGQIAVVRLGDEYTLKRVYIGPDYVELRAENPLYAPIILRGADLESDHFQVVGLAVAYLSRIR